MSIALKDRSATSGGERPNPSATALVEKYALEDIGGSSRPAIFLHGFGCDQRMWGRVAPHFADTMRVITYDHVGCGRSDLRAYDPVRYADLDGYADDLAQVCETLRLTDALVVGHSVSSMIAMLAAQKTARISEIVMVCPSPCYRNLPGYQGGFDEAELEELLEFLETDHIGWSQIMAPAIMGAAEQPELAEELADSFCRTDPEIARIFGRATFLSDYRAALPLCSIPALVLQTKGDVVAPLHIGPYIADHLQDGRLVNMEAHGHCPHVSAPAEVIEAIRNFVGRPK